MSVSAAEVVALRAEGEAMSLDHVDTTFNTPAENLGYLIHQLRSIGADQAEVLHDIELLVRATDMWREEVREARDTLGALGYGTDVTKLLTGLARRAKPRPPTWRQRMAAKAAEQATT